MQLYMLMKEKDAHKHMKKLHIRTKAVRAENGSALCCYSEILFYCFFFLKAAVPVKSILLPRLKC